MCLLAMSAGEGSKYYVACGIQTRGQISCGVGVVPLDHNFYLKHVVSHPILLYPIFHIPLPIYLISEETLPPIGQKTASGLGRCLLASGGWCAPSDSHVAAGTCQYA